MSEKQKLEKLLNKYRKKDKNSVGLHLKICKGCGLKFVSIKEDDPVCVPGCKK